MARHTGGPWSTHNTVANVVVAPDKTCVAYLYRPDDVGGKPRPTEEGAAANFRLVEAAPSLYDLLARGMEVFARYGEADGEADGWLDAVQHRLARIDGGEG